MSSNVRPPKDDEEKIKAKIAILQGRSKPLKDVVADILGEEPEQARQKEETSKFIEPVSKDAVAQARANGQTNAQIRRTFQKMGVDNAKIIELLFD